VSGGAINPIRAGLHAAYLAPVGLFKGHDRYIVIMCAFEHQWRALCEVMGNPELANDPRFGTRDARLKNLSALVDTIEQWLNSMPGDDAAIAAMKEARVPVAPVLTVAEAVNHPHLRERGTVRTVHDRILGNFDLPGFALRFSDFPKPLELQAPFLGEHNAEVLIKYAGCSTSEIDALERQGILHHGTR